MKPAGCGQPMLILQAAIGPADPWDRLAREELEDATMAAGATRASGEGNRPRPEQPDELRTCFERDRDRILHAAPFRRLAGKTQVLVFPDDHQRTRLTHALEVAQVATSIARGLRLNVALTEAIALGHDCGQRPGAGTPGRRRPRAVPSRRVRPRPLGRRRRARPAQPLCRNQRRDPQSLMVAAGAVDPRRRGGLVGRPHRLRVPRLRGRHVRRCRDPSRPAG